MLVLVEHRKHRYFINTEPQSTKLYHYHTPLGRSHQWSVRPDIQCLFLLDNEMWGWTDSKSYNVAKIEIGSGFWMQKSTCSIVSYANNSLWSICVKVLTPVIKSLLYLRVPSNLLYRGGDCRSKNVDSCSHWSNDQVTG